jgi:hypothetical protein
MSMMNYFFQAVSLHILRRHYAGHCWRRMTGTWAADEGLLPRDRERNKLPGGYRILVARGWRRPYYRAVMIRNDS